MIKYKAFNLIGQDYYFVSRNRLKIDERRKSPPVNKCSAFVNYCHTKISIPASQMKHGRISEVSNWNGREENQDNYC
jgi:hypothetical protein